MTTTVRTAAEDKALLLMFSPIVLAFVIGALPVILPYLLVQRLSRSVSGHAQTSH